MPFEYSGEKIAEIKKKFEEYVEKTEMPIIAEFAYQNNVRRQFLYENSILSDIRVRAMAKKEAYLERAGLENKVNPTICRLSLMQIGWLEKTGNENINLNTDNPESFKKAKKQVEEIFE